MPPPSEHSILWATKWRDDVSHELIRLDNVAADAWGKISRSFVVGVTASGKAVEALSRTHLKEAGRSFREFASLAKTGPPIAADLVKNLAPILKFYDSLDAKSRQLVGANLPALFTDLDKGLMDVGGTLLRLAEGPPKTFVAAMKSMRDIFGRAMPTEMVESIQTALELSIEAGGKHLDSIRAMLKQFGRADLADFLGKVPAAAVPGDLGKIISKAIIPAIRGAQPGVASAAAGLSGFIGGVFGKIFGGIKSGISSAFGQLALGALIGRALGPIGDVVSDLLMFLFQPLQLAALDLITAFRPVIEVLFPIIHRLFGSLMSALSPLIQVNTQFIAQLLDALAPALIMVADLVGALIAPLADLFQAILQPLMAILRPVLSIVASLLKPFIAALGMLSPLFQALGPLFAAMMRPLAVILDLLAKLVEQGMQEWIDRLTPIIELTMQGLLPMLEYWATGIEMATRFLEKAVSWIPGMGKKAGATEPQALPPMPMPPRPYAPTMPRPEIAWTQPPRGGAPRPAAPVHPRPVAEPPAAPRPAPRPEPSGAIQAGLRTADKAVGGLGGALYDFGRDLAEMVRGRPKGGTEDVVQAINHLEKSFVGAVGSLRDALTASAVPDRGWTDLEESGDRASEFTE